MEGAMDILKDFAQKDMIEQITLLEEIRANRWPEAVDGLLQLYAEALADQAVDEMVYHVLFELLRGQEGLIAAILHHPSPRVQILAARRAAEEESRAALPALLSLLKTSSAAEVLMEVIRALGKFPEPEVAESLLPFLTHGDYTVVGWSMRALAGSGDPRVRAALMGMISGDQGTSREECDLRVVMAVKSLAAFRDAEAVDFLIGNLRHPCPALRKEIIGVLAAMGNEALPGLERRLDAGGRDERIMAVNVIGLIGGRQSADILVTRLQDGSVLETNLKFAVYEALGRIPTMRSMVGLADGLAEEDEMVLLAVVTASNQLCNPGMVKEICKVLAGGGRQREKLLQAIITARAGKLFAELYKVEAHGEAMINLLVASGDREAAAVFAADLAQMTGARAAADRQRLTGKEGASRSCSKRILAVDDSKAMLYFYRGLATALGIDLVTADNGREAFDLLQDSSPIDLLITDMNMPEMDGVELVREVRKQARWAELPILMATTESERRQIDLAMRAGVNELIHKPFTSEQLQRRIEAVFAFRQRGNVN